MSLNRPRLNLTLTQASTFSGARQAAEASQNSPTVFFYIQPNLLGEVFHLPAVGDGVFQVDGSIQFLNKALPFIAVHNFKRDDFFLFAQ